MDFFVYSRAAIERVPAHEVPHLVVSITSRADDVARIPENEHTLEIVRVAFLDVGPEAPGAMSTDDARKILDAFDRHRDRLTRVVVHCDAGRSRSPAVALALARHASQPAPDLAGGTTPNAHVLSTMAATSLAQSSAR